MGGKPKYSAKAHMVNKGKKPKKKGKNKGKKKKNKGKKKKY